MNGKETITLKQVLAEMQASVEPFALRFVKLNETKGTGGEIIELSNQLQSGRAKQPEPAPKLGSRADVDELEAWVGRNPNHYEHMTRNLVSKINGRYTKVHIYLILEFNGKKVII